MVLGEQINIVIRTSVYLNEVKLRLRVVIGSDKIFDRCTDASLIGCNKKIKKKLPEKE